VGIECLAFSPSGDKLAVGRDEGVIEIYEVSTWHLTQRIAGGVGKSVRSLCWTAPTTLYSSGLTGEITEWDLNSLSARRDPVPTGGGPAWRMCHVPRVKGISDEGVSHFFLACDDGTVRWFTYEHDASKQGKNNGSSMRDDDDDDDDTTSYSSSSLELRKHAQGSTNSRLLSVTSAGEDNGEYVFTGDGNGNIYRWELPSLACDAKMALKCPNPSGGGAGARAKSKLTKKMESIENMVRGTRRRGENSHKDTNTEGRGGVEGAEGCENENMVLVWALESLRRGTQIASGDNHGRVTIWDVHTCTHLQTLEQHQADVLCLVWVTSSKTATHNSVCGERKSVCGVVNDEQFLFSAGMDAKISIFSAYKDEKDGTQEGDGKKKHSLSGSSGKWAFFDALFGHTHDIRALAVSPLSPGPSEFGSVVSGGVDATVSIQDWSTKHKAFKMMCLSPFSHPLPVSLSETNAVALVQRSNHAEIWYFNRPSEGESTSGSSGAGTSKEKRRKIDENEEVVPRRNKRETAPKKHKEDEDEDEEEGSHKLKVHPMELPKPQRLIDVSLDTSSHLLSSALAPDNRHFALSNQEGTRLFALTVEELEIRRISPDYTSRSSQSHGSKGAARVGKGESRSSVSVLSHPASVLCFLNPMTLAIGSLRTNELFIVSIEKNQNQTKSGRRAGESEVPHDVTPVLGRFDHHKAPISLITHSTTREWLCTSDVSGAIHLFNIDTLTHYARIPSFANGHIPTAISFTHYPNGKKDPSLLAVSSAHQLLCFNIHNKELCQDTVKYVKLKQHQRVYGIVTNAEHPHKVLLWSASRMVKLNLSIKNNKKSDDNNEDEDEDEDEDVATTGEESGKESGKENRGENSKDAKKKKNNKRIHRGRPSGHNNNHSSLPLFSRSESHQWEHERCFRWIQALMETPWKRQSLLLLETTPTDFQASLPPQFERKTWGR